MVIFAITSFATLVVLADYLDVPRSYSSTVLKGNPTYYDNFLEAFYLRERGMDPYKTSEYFSQNYLLFWVLFQLRNCNLLMKMLNITFILSTAVLLGQILGGPKRFRTTIMAVLLVNPVTVGLPYLDLLLQREDHEFFPLQLDNPADLHFGRKAQVPHQRFSLRSASVREPSRPDLHLCVIADFLGERQT